jgi:hypothetical protein
MGRDCWFIQDWRIRFFFGENCGDPGNDGAMSKCIFKCIKKAFRHQDYSNQVLEVYDGDKSVTNPQHSHGNAKRPKKTEKPFYRTNNQPTESVYRHIAKGAKIRLVIRG